MANNYDPAAITKMMMQGYAFNSRPFEEAVRVTGKVALVTGGTSGLGFCVALRLLQGGANVVVASFSEKEAETAMPLFAQTGFDETRVKFCKCDVTKEDQVAAAVKFTADTFGSLDILVTCAAIWSYAHINDMPEEAFTKVIDVNLNGTFRCAKHASDYMIAHKIKGKMVFVSSDVFTMPYLVFGGYPHYAASKGGIVALATEVARELKRYGILVNTVAPGVMSTPGAMSKGNQVVPTLPAEKQKELWAEISLKAQDQMDEIPDTDAVALTVYMMCTALSDSITGDCILADRGMTHDIKARQPAFTEYPPKA